MPIKVACACGAAFAAKDELAGRTVACPKCKQPLKIPAPQAAAQPAALAPQAPIPHSNAGLFDDLGLKARDANVPRCPGCGADMAPNAILCIKCGYNLKLGKKMQTMNMAADPNAALAAGGGGGHGGHGGDVTAMIMARAARNADEDVEEEKKKTGEGMPIWVLVVAVLACVLFGVVMSLIPQATALQGTGAVLLVANFLLVIFSWLGVTIRAAMKNPLFGALVFIGDLAILGIAFALIYFISEETLPRGATRFILMMVGACSTGYAYSDESCAKFMFYLQVAYALRLVGLILLIIGGLVSAASKEDQAQLPASPATRIVQRIGDDHDQFSMPRAILADRA